HTHPGVCRRDWGDPGRVLRRGAASRRRRAVGGGAVRDRDCATLDDGLGAAVAAALALPPGRPPDVTLGPPAQLSIAALTAVLPLSVPALAPAQPGTPADRVGYEYVAQHGFAPDCPHNIFCYRLLVPLALDALPGPEVARWRVFACLANIATGVLLG